jgi:hypothetical protein
MEGSLVAYKVFTNGSVLQASEINDNLMRQATAVFSNAAARTAAITSPVEGQLTYLEDTNLYHYWNGSAWVSPFGSTLLSTTGFTNVASVSFNNVFSSQFANYRIVFRIDQFTPGAALHLRLRIGGSDSSSSYNFTHSVIASTFDFKGRSASNTATQMVISSNDMFGTKFGEVYLFSPNEVAQTFLTSYGGSGGGVQSIASGDHFSNTQFDGFTVFASAGNITGTVNVYGLRK